jgi:hypothetical protein
MKRVTSFEIMKVRIMNKIFAAAVLGIAFTSLQVNAGQGGDYPDCYNCLKDVSSECKKGKSYKTCLQGAIHFCQEGNDCPNPLED